MRSDFANGESQSLGKPEKALQNCQSASQENCLNDTNTRICKYGFCGFFVAENRLQRSTEWLQFSFSQQEYYCSMRKGDSV
jgi:hypothetical protein